MRQNVMRLVVGLAVAGLLAPLAAPQEEGAPQPPGRRPRPGMAAQRGVAFDGLALREEEFHIVSLRLIDRRRERGPEAGPGQPEVVLPGRKLGLLLFGTGRYGVVFEAAAPAKTLKGVIVALERPRGLKGKERSPAGVPRALAEVIEKGRKVGTLELQVKPYEGRIVATGKAEFTEGTYKGSWRLILFTRPTMRQLPRPGPVQTQPPAAE